ncbi:MAG: hypothetical protein JST82_14775 [Bacteroidetes bacterium]|nr:hypothetical protein [Bacteroidota bacterium]
MESKNIYYISGMGADESIFHNIHIKGYNMVYLPWVKHESKDDLESYAVKMATQIKEENPIIMGLSFGGMLTSEITNHIAVKKAFLISSSKNRFEMPGLVTMNRWLASLNILPHFLYNTPNEIMYYYLGAETAEEKGLIYTMMNKANGAFMGWIVKAMATWKNEKTNSNIVHIHGDKDKLIEPEKVKADYIIKGGSHLMIYNRADEINAIITKELSHVDNL